MGVRWNLVTKPRILIESADPSVDLSDIARAVTRMTYTSNVKKMDKAVLYVENTKNRFSNDPRFDLEIIIKLKWGYPGHMSPTKTMVVVQIAPSVDGGVPQLVFFLNDKGQKILSGANHNWGSASSSAIATRIARNHRLVADVVESNDGRREHRVQGGTTTDYEFLARLADRINYDFWIDDAGLHFRPVDTSASPVHRFAYFRDPISIFQSFQPIIKKGKMHRTRHSGVGGDGNAHAANPHRTQRPMATHRRTDIQVNNQDITRRTEQDAGNIAISSAETDNRVRQIHANASQNKAEMNAINMNGKSIGYPTIFARNLIDIVVFEIRFSGLWRVTEAVHDIGDDGYDLGMKLKRAEVNGGRGERQNAVNRNNASASEVLQRETDLHTRNSTVSRRVEVTRRR